MSRSVAGVNQTAATAANTGGVRSAFETESARLKLLLSDQIERQAMREARETAISLLCLDPVDADILHARVLIDEHLAMATPHPIGEVHCLANHTHWVNCVAFSPDSRRALSGGGGDTRIATKVRGSLDRSIRLWDVQSGQMLRRYLGRLGMVTGIAFFSDGLRAISSNYGSGVHLWDLENGDTIRQFDRNVVYVHGVASSADDRWVLACGKDRLIHQWDAGTGDRVRQLAGHTDTVSSVAFSRDGRWIISGSYDKTVRLWNAESGKLLHTFTGHTDRVLTVAISDDGRQALSGGADHVLRWWDCESGLELGCLQGHTGPVNSLALSPDGQRAVSGGADKSVRVWDLATVRELKCFQAHADEVMSVAYAPDGNYVLSGSRDATVRLWQAPVGSVSPLPAEQLALLDRLPYSTVVSCVRALSQSRILDMDQMAELTGAMQSRFTNPKPLLEHLLDRGWLTAYQLEELIEGRGVALRLGEYSLRESLGSGGMGHVFKARRVGTGQQVALKIVLPELTSDAEALQQFQWEIHSLTQMAHPNIIKTYDAGSDRDRYYFTMEYVEGIDLYRLLQKFGPLPVDQARDYIRQAALGLEHAHEHCLIHRDIKPANLFLTFPSIHGDLDVEGEASTPKAVVKILDWGLASLRLPKGGQRIFDHLPREQNVGTADYISPEQARNSAAGADIRTDIYSLGCTLYHLLAGTPPFSGKSIMQKLIKHQTEEPVPIQTLRPDVPESLALVIKKMMAKLPEDRFPTPSVVAVALSMTVRTDGRT